MLAIFAGVAAAVAGYAGAATMMPGSQFYGRTLTHGSDPGQLALTYDDGPNDPHTLRLLEVLERHQAKATFFMIGRHVRQRPDIARAVQAAGHAIGNHTYTHPNLIFVPVRRLRQELDDCRKALEDAIGTPNALFRPPFGGRRSPVLRVARELGMTTVMWSVTAYDWKPKPAETVFNNVVTRLKRRGNRRSEIVLMHDGGHLQFGADRAHTVEATRALLEKYSALGKKFVTIPDLATT